MNTSQQWQPLAGMVRCEVGHSNYSYVNMYHTNWLNLKDKHNGTKITAKFMATKMYITGLLKFTALTICLGGHGVFVY